MSDEWFHLRDSSQFGPYTLPELRTMLSRGRIGPGDSFCARGRQATISFDELVRQFTAADRTEHAQSQDYYVFSGPDQVGPLSQAALREGVSTGRFQPGDRVLRDDWSETIPLWRVAQFVGIFAAFARAEDPRASLFADLNGDGRLDTRWADLDGDGRMDALVTDVTGDGQFDTVVADLNGDGIADAVAFDTNNDGMVDAVAVDTDHDGTFDGVGIDTDHDGQIDVVGVDLDGDGDIDAIGQDLDADGDIDDLDIDFDF
jgi:hypothetical protein